jgi:transposase-like protein
MAPKTPQRRLTSEERARIHALHYNAGWSYLRISQELGIPDGTVRHCALTRLTPQKPRGRHPLLSTPLRQRLVSYATASHEQRLKPLRQVAHELNINVDQRTLTKVFAKDGYHRRVATERPLLTPKHINDRLWWAATCVALPQSICNRVI